MKKTDAPTPYSRRVATCLNALKGVPDEWLEQYADGKSIKNIVEQSCDLVRKEEELTVALLATEEENAALKAENDALKTAIPSGDDRVYACLTACVGFATDDLEEMNGTFMQIIHRLGKERDELVVALRNLRQGIHEDFHGTYITEEADEILAKYQEKP